MVEKMRRKNMYESELLAEDEDVEDEEEDEEEENEDEEDEGEDIICHVVWSFVQVGFKLC